MDTKITPAEMASNFERVAFEWVAMPLDALLAKFLHLEGDDALSDFEVGGPDGFGGESSCTGEEVRRSIEMQRMWAFASTDETPLRVYYWAAPDCPRRNLVAMLGHELGHLLQAVDRPKDADLDDEIDADRAAMVAEAVAVHLGLVS